MKIASSALEAIQAHAAEGYPHEICGILVGPRGSRTATEAKRARNIIVERAWSGYVYLIVSVANGEAVDANAFVAEKDGGPFHPETLDVL